MPRTAIDFDSGSRESNTDIQFVLDERTRTLPYTFVEYVKETARNMQLIVQADRVEERVLDYSTLLTDVGIKVVISSSLQGVWCL